MTDVYQPMTDVCATLTVMPAELVVLDQLLRDLQPRVIACSGGIDSLLLATLAHRQQPEQTVVAHAISPAVPLASTARVREWAAREGWNLQLVQSGEFGDEAYLSNPVNRCYYCKSNLYSSMALIAAQLPAHPRASLCSGANTDDLGEYRPGLVAATEHQVRHPLLEAGISKAMIRTIARNLQLPFAELPASPCLASRLYTGTRVTAGRLRAVELAEMFIRAQTGLGVVRCRMRDNAMLVETAAGARAQITPTLLAALDQHLRAEQIVLTSIALDPQPYRPGRAFVAAASIPAMPVTLFDPLQATPQ